MHIKSELTKPFSFTQTLNTSGVYGTLLFITANEGSQVIGNRKDEAFLLPCTFDFCGLVKTGSVGLKDVL